MSFLFWGMFFATAWVLASGGCAFDPKGIGTHSLNDAQNQDAAVQDSSIIDAAVQDGSIVDTAVNDASLEDAQLQDSTLPDAQIIDAYVPDADTSCVNGTFECVGEDAARVCQNGEWTPLGTCPMGCDEVGEHCYVPSNVPANVMDGSSATGEVNAAEAASPLIINTDTGHISDANGDIRPAGNGLDANSGIYYGQQGQANASVELGVFVMSELTIGDNVDVQVVGNRALVLLVDGDVFVAGVFSLRANLSDAGPGGFNGGAEDTAGQGPCPGQPGAGVAFSDWGCSSGSGGGGYGATGGDGGNNYDNCDTSHENAGGGGGLDNCGSPDLVPLMGGSGGAGGSTMVGEDPTAPGAGGGGGGAIQISSSSSISFNPYAGINAGGGGGKQTISGGGSGGGSGGAILLEAPSITLEANVVLAANGGGGGAGDCS